MRSLRKKVSKATGLSGTFSGKKGKATDESADEADRAADAERQRAQDLVVVPSGCHLMLSLWRPHFFLHRRTPSP